jgi:hypothetical protein
MASLLAALGLKTNVDRSGYVPFASTILIELWQQPWDGQFVVQV